MSYGRDTGGATFHTLRHLSATMVAAMGIAEGLQKEAMGHLSLIDDAVAHTPGAGA